MCRATFNQRTLSSIMAISRLYGKTIILPTIDSLNSVICGTLGIPMLKAGPMSANSNASTEWRRWWLNSCLCPTSWYRRHSSARKSFTGRGSSSKTLCKWEKLLDCASLWFVSGLLLDGWLRRRFKRCSQKQSTLWSMCGVLRALGSDIIRSKVWNKTSWALLACLEAGSLSTTRSR